MTLKALVAAIGAGFGYFFGAPDQLLTIMLVLVAINWITQVATTPKQTARGVYAITMQQLMLVVLAGLGNFVAPVFGVAVSGSIRDLVIYFVIANEILAILVCAHNLGVPIPPIFLTLLGTTGGPLGQALQVAEKTPAGAQEMQELAAVPAAPAAAPVAAPEPAPQVVPITETAPAPPVTQEAVTPPVTLDSTVVDAITKAMKEAIKNG